MLAIHRCMHGRESSCYQIAVLVGTSHANYAIRVKITTIGGLKTFLCFYKSSTNMSLHNLGRIGPLFSMLPYAHTMIILLIKRQYALLNIIKHLSTIHVSLVTTPFQAHTCAQELMAAYIRGSELVVQSLRYSDDVVKNLVLVSR